MSVRDIIQGAAGATTVDKTYIEDVFSAYLYKGTGDGVTTNQTITNGLNLVNNKGMVWIKGRSVAANSCLTDTVRGYGTGTSYPNNKGIASNLSDTANPDGSDYLSMFLATGFRVTQNSGTVATMSTNNWPHTYSSWTFIAKAKFFDVQTKSHTTGTASTVDLSSLGTVGCVYVKRTDSTGSWYVWHRSLTSGYNLYLEQTAAAFNTNAYLSVSGTTLTIAGGMPSGSYVVYAYAHDTTADGLIQCGTYNGANQTVTLGWEPQFVMIKQTSGSGNWLMFDNMRGIATGYSDARLYANSSAAEVANTDYISVTSTGFTVTGSNTDASKASTAFIYMAIRRGPMRVPADGTKVFQPVVRQGSGAAAVVNTTITPDLVIHKVRGTTGGSLFWLDRLRDNNYLVSAAPLGGSTNSEGQTTASFPVQMFDNQTGYDIAGSSADSNSTSYSYIDWVFKRAPGFFDIVAYTGTGSAQTVKHNLGVDPELTIIKQRSPASTNGWYVWSKSLSSSSASGKMLLNSTDLYYAGDSMYGSVAPTSTQLTFANVPADVNGSGNTYVAYLFASCPGVSKVGTYTGDGSTPAQIGQTINCGFTAGARFVMIKRTDSTGDWYVWDSARGIVAGADGHLSLNSNAAEVTTDDSVDPVSTGFKVNQVAATNINVVGATYLYLAIA